MSGFNPTDVSGEIMKPLVDESLKEIGKPLDDAKTLAQIHDIRWGEINQTEVKAESIADLFDCIDNNEANSIELSQGISYRTSDNPSDMLEKKDTFYPNAYAEQREAGYTVYEETDLKGSGNIRPLDGIITKDDVVSPNEIKSPNEIGAGADYRGTTLKNDYIAEDRANIKERILNGEIRKEVGDIEVYMAQAEKRTDQFINGEWGIKEGSIDIEGKQVKPSITVPQNEKINVISALKDKGIKNYEVIDGNRTFTVIYDKA